MDKFYIVKRGTQKYTKILGEKELSYNCSRDFMVLRNSDDFVLADIHFQDGPIKEVGVNGVANEDLIVMVIERLEQFQNSPFACEENANAIQKLNEALNELRNRTNKRIMRGVEGKSEI